ncbi:MAG TPA: class I SAM-dependent methyltransferase [Gemmatimonadaceae bacterium]|jgi:malonyl-CoA O-methyltransferase
MTALTARDGYRLWAPRYETETAVSALEELTVRRLGIETRDRALLDVGCGTTRRLRESGAAFGVGIDLSADMLIAGGAAVNVAAGDVRALPLVSSAFDVIWCRLVIGHVRAIATCYGELARVARNRGMIVVSDICPEAIAAGHRRTFRDAAGDIHELEHFVHSRTAHERAATRVGLELHSCVDGMVGPEIEHFYNNAGRGAAYEQQRGHALVRVFSWQNVGAAA